MVDIMTTKVVELINELHSERNPMHIEKLIAPRIPHIEKNNKVRMVHCWRPHKRKQPPNAKTTIVRLVTHNIKITTDIPNVDQS